MEALAYTHLSTVHEEGIDYDLPELKLNLQQIPSSAWLGVLGIAVLFGCLNTPEPASAAQYYVRTNGRCLNARSGPSTSAGIYTCVRNGAPLAAVVGFENGFARLSTGRYVSAAYISTTSGGRPTPGPGVGGTVLRPGSSGPAVRAVQGFLGVPVDGVYGSVTTNAVRNFQARNGILVDGIVGPQTRRLLGV